MKNLFLLWLVLASPLAFSQGITVVSNEQIPISSSEGGYFPVISPTGDYIVISGGAMNGLQKYDLATQKLTTLTTDRSAGVNVQISSDGSTIVYRSSEYKDRLRYTSLNSINVHTGKKEQLIKSTRNLEGVSMKEGTVLAVENGKMKSKKVSGKKISSTPPVTSIKNGQLYVTENNVTKQVSPSGTEFSYLWASVSPDGKKLLYYVMEQGKAYVSNLDGSNPVSLGILRAPSWMGNDWVVGMVDRDNGEVVTSSKIVAVNVQANTRTTLTDESVIAMSPSASIDATKIVYNTADGRIFLMQVETSK